MNLFLSFFFFGRASGGGSTRTQPAGSGVPQLTLVKSQTRDNFRVKALQACQQRQFPVVLIVSLAINKGPHFLHKKKGGIVAHNEWMVAGREEIFRNAVDSEIWLGGICRAWILSRHTFLGMKATHNATYLPTYTLQYFECLLLSARKRVHERTTAQLLYTF